MTKSATRAALLSRKELQDAFSAFVKETNETIFGLNKQLNELRGALTAAQRSEVAQIALDVLEPNRAEHLKLIGDAARALNHLCEAGAIDRTALDSAIVNGRPN